MVSCATSDGMYSCTRDISSEPVVCQPGGCRDSEVAHGRERGNLLPWLTR